MSHFLKFLKHSNPSMNTQTVDLMCYETLEGDYNSVTHVSPRTPPPPPGSPGLSDATTVDMDVEEPNLSLAALMSRRTRVNPVKMLASTYYVQDFREWVDNLWYIAHHLHLNSQIIHIAVRTFAVFLTTQNVTPWPLLKWERYACLWIGMKIDDNDYDFSCSMDAFLGALFGEGVVLKSEKQALRRAENAVLDANKFALSFPLPTDYADVLLDILGVPANIRTATFAVLAHLTRRHDFLIQDPLLVAAASIYHVTHEHIQTLVRLTGCEEALILRLTSMFNQ
jgi:hypothetical protein